MASKSSAKKVARLARKGKGKKVRFQGGTVFPLTMAVVTAVGLVLVGYARGSAPSNEVRPTTDDHWHISIGFWGCDRELGNLVGTKDDGSNAAYERFGVHSHDDGVIHWHPESAAAGTNAALGAYLDTYGVEVSTDKLVFPADQFGGASFERGTDKCIDETGEEVDGQIQAWVWERYDNQSAKRKLITDFSSIRITNDGMAIMIAFAPAGATIPMPASASDLAGMEGQTDDEPGSATTVAPTTTGG